MDRPAAARSCRMMRLRSPTRSASWTPVWLRTRAVANSQALRPRETKRMGGIGASLQLLRSRIVPQPRENTSQTPELADELRDDSPTRARTVKVAKLLHRLC